MRFINSTPVHHAIILAFLLAGAAWTGWGFAQFSSLPDALPWHGDAGWRFAGLLAALSLAVFLASKIARLPYLYGAALATVLIVTVLGKLWPLCVVAWIALSSILLGEKILALLGAKPADWLISLLVGVDCLPRSFRYWRISRSIIRCFTPRC